MSWNSTTEEKLRKYWKLGYSGSKIAQLLGEGATRNSVLGKAFRLKLESRTPSKKSADKTNTKKNNPVETKTPKLGRKARFQALLLDKNFQQENPKKLEELTDETCKWPIGHPHEENFYFCGRTSRDGNSYCSLHYLYAFQKKDEKEEDKITEEDIPNFIQKKIKSA